MFSFLFLVKYLLSLLYIIFPPFNVIYIIMSRLVDVNVCLETMFRKYYHTTDIIAAIYSAHYGK